MMDGLYPSYSKDERRDVKRDQILESEIETKILASKPFEIELWALFIYLIILEYI